MQISLKNENALNFLVQASFIFLGALIIVWPLPHTLFLRQVFLLCALMLAFTFLKMKKIKFSELANPIAGLLLLFFIWVVVHFIFISFNPQEELKQFKGVWIRVLASLFLGILFKEVLELSKRTNCMKWLYIWIAFMFMPIAIIVLNIEAFDSIHSMLNHAFYARPYGDKHSAVYYGGIFSAIFFSAIYYSGRFKSNWLMPASIVGLVAVGVMFFLVNTKNGMLIFFLQGTVFFLALFFREYKHGGKYRYLKYLFVAIFTIFLTHHVARNDSWRQLQADAVVAVDIEHYPHWKDNRLGYPANYLGKITSATNYERLAWAVAGINLLHDYPYGYGLLKQSFGYLALEKWGGEINKNSVRSTHSGWIDFSLAYGLPGIFLLISIGGLIFLKSLRDQTIFGRMGVALIPTVYFIWLVAEVCTGHFIEFLFFILGFFSLVGPRKIIK